ncbi:hypothetical protein NUU61_003358 [Penicillium alfredii]|uniref:Uncharacterized protein n=1 Tax=Penicillium alfredii TaxID=1506179 RepID=A0A9W9FT74_9EURO|nr:uncharacterized protein NUU61_003358 [Penicillium alfredii]KAJ5106011.1 hypothetical protein NUU61_003358 [Penicillium alfredii]
MSLADTDREQIKTRNRYRRALRATMETICSAETHHIEPNVCEKASIVRQPLSLNEKSDGQPLFFDRYQGRLQDRRTPDSTWSEYNADLENYENVRILYFWIKRYIRDQSPLEPAGSYDVGCHDLYEIGDYFWKVVNASVPMTNPGSGIYPANLRNVPNPNPPLPHVKCLMESDVMGDNRLLRGEIMAIIHVMDARLSAKSLRPHLMAPMLLISTMGPWHFRVLEAYFNGDKLVVRNTPLYDMRQGTEAKAADLCLWWYGKVKGNTQTLLK